MRSGGGGGGGATATAFDTGRKYRSASMSSNDGNSSRLYRSGAAAVNTPGDALLQEMSRNGERATLLHPRSRCAHNTIN